MNARNDRSRWIGGGVVIVAAVAVTVFVVNSFWLGAMQADSQQVSAEKRVQELGLKLPTPTPPSNPYVSAVRVGNLLYLSGMGPRREDGTFIKGKVAVRTTSTGDFLTTDQGKAAARRVGITMLGVVRSHLGSLDKVKRLVKVLGMVNSTPEFTAHPAVINGFSELMVEVFGEEAGKGARSAVGMGSLPGNIPVEIEAIFEVSD